VLKRLQLSAGFTGLREKGWRCGEQVRWVLWHSYDGGSTFSEPVPFDTMPQDSQTRGGDADVVVAPNGNVIVADLDVSYAWIQVSTDHGKTFNIGTSTAPEDDRPWLAISGNNVYVGLPRLYGRGARRVRLYGRRADVRAV
jgi:hypothetical protein